MDQTEKEYSARGNGAPGNACTGDHPTSHAATVLTPRQAPVSTDDDQEVSALDLLLRADGQALDRAADRGGD